MTKKHKRSTLEIIQEERIARRHETAMFCPTKIVLWLDNGVSFSTGPAEMVLMSTTTHVYTHFQNVYVLCIQNREKCMHRFI